MQALVLTVYEAAERSASPREAYVFLLSHGSLYAYPITRDGDVSKSALLSVEDLGCARAQTKLWGPNCSGAGEVGGEGQRTCLTCPSFALVLQRPIFTDHYQYPLFTTTTPMYLEQEDSVLIAKAAQWKERRTPARAMPSKGKSRTWPAISRNAPRTSNLRTKPDQLVGVECTKEVA